MKINLSQSLINLASILPKPLYLVGGYVRNSLLEYKDCGDIDLAAELTPKEITEYLKDTAYTVASASKKLGTVIICYKEERYEFTTFRVDSYPNDGSHAPCDVSFTRDISLDARRRDFSVNAIYYDIKANEIIDPTNGIEDIKRRVIRTTDDPNRIFKEDALRILRMVRLASELDFEIEEKTYISAKKLAKSIAMLSAERIRDELEKMMHADTKYGVYDAHYRSICILDDLGALQFILPELNEGKGVEQKPEYHIYDVFGHIMHVYKESKPNVRLAALLHDIAKPRMKRLTGRMAGHDREGCEMTREIMNRLRYSKDEINRCSRLVLNHMYDLKLETSEKKLRRFIIDNLDIFEDLIDLKNADSMGGKMRAANPSAVRLRDTFNQMLSDNVAFSIKQLKVDGRDLMALNVPENKRGEALKALLYAQSDGSLSKREEQLKFLKAYK